MRSRLDTFVELIHAQAEAALATHSASMAGYPFASSVAFATDLHHRPVLLLSALAEHTRNLAANEKASLLVSRALGDGETARISLVGRVARIDPDERLVRRYLRYHPEADLFLQLGDFRFHRFEAARILVVGGFAQAGWLDARHLAEARFVELGTEADLIAAVQPQLPKGVELLGIDPYGVDLRQGGARQRVMLAPGALTADSLLAQLAARPATR